MKQPAYAKQLTERRRAGEHPERVIVIYGNDWYVAPGIARLAVKPGAALGLDWRSVAGLPVRLVDRSKEWPDECFFLAGEIARHAATLHLAAFDKVGFGVEVGELAYIGREWDAEQRVMRWPAWWSDELEQLHGQNTQRWLAEITAALAA